MSTLNLLQGKVVIELLPDKTVRLSSAHRVPVIGQIKRSAVRKALAMAELACDLLIAEWQAMHP